MTKMLIKMDVIKVDINKIINYNNKTMRQDMRERQRQIRRLHENIQKYQQSPRTRKIVEQATFDLINAIEYKFKKSSINQNYTFPRIQQQDKDQYAHSSQIIDLKIQKQFISQELSIAQQAQSNHVYISQKTTLLHNRLFLPEQTQSTQQKNRLKIKVIKKSNNFETCELAHKYDRLKTQQINFSTINFKKQIASVRFNHHHDLNSIKNKYFNNTNTDHYQIKKKLKISSNLKNYKYYQKSPQNNLTMKTQYSCKRRQGKQNVRVPLSSKQQSNLIQKHFISQNSFKKIQQSQPQSSQPYLKYPLKRKKQNSSNISLLQTQKNCKIAHRSSQNLKSIRLGRISTQKLKNIKALYA